MPNFSSPDLGIEAARVIATLDPAPLAPEPEPKRHLYSVPPPEEVEDAKVHVESPESRAARIQLMSERLGLLHEAIKAGDIETAQRLGFYLPIAVAALDK